MGDIEKRVKEIIVEQLGVNESEVTLEAKFVDDLGADSLDSSNWSWPWRRSTTWRFPTRMRKRLLQLEMRLSISRPTLKNKSMDLIQPENGGVS